MNRFFTKTLEVDVTFRVALDRDDVCERSRLPDVYRSPDVFRLPAKKIERGPHENRKINANPLHVDDAEPRPVHVKNGVV